MRFCANIIWLLILVSCNTAPSTFTVNVMVRPQNPTIVPGAAVALLSSMSGNVGGDARYRWTIEGPRECKLGLEVNDAPVTQFRAPSGCQGKVMITLTVTRDKVQASATEVVQVSAMDPATRAIPAASAASPDALPRAATSAPGQDLRFELDRIFPFQDDKQLMKVRHEERGSKIFITLSADDGQGFGGVCLIPKRPGFDASGFAALEFSAPSTDSNLIMHVKLERTDSGCAQCQCYLYRAPAKDLPRKPDGKVHFPLGGCKDMLVDLGRVCFAADATTWPKAPAELAMNVGDVTLVRHP